MQESMAWEILGMIARIYVPECFAVTGLGWSLSGGCLNRHFVIRF